MRVLQLRRTSSTYWPTWEVHEVIADIHFGLILVELFRLLSIDLQEQRDSIGVAVGNAIVSLLRETIVHGALETEAPQILAAGLFFWTMALLMLVSVWLPPTFAGGNPGPGISAEVPFRGFDRQPEAHLQRHFETTGRSNLPCPEP
ncbi:phosphate-starvation-inducible PsiE family protein [Synechococcus sp. CS-1332]|uniref:phosphate-starvation-inducible PsiE family protein n=1 Tax=Synechococcus sp. CS-1332 TaxID=2847972 RepID=UPI00223B75A5|nr:phosphate-starvation-inducible PsiE family protein [Synechococcus sp. CS-1332]MCT0206919.1 phosphate-starvation-inducible PsiE family protein [Synechococcus sp. CS-1332]